MNPLALLVLGQATLVAVRPDSRVACPTPTQVTLALTARVPGALVTPERARELGALMLELESGPDGATHLRLVGDGGRERLRRDLATADEQRDCAGLAETVALIVERFVVDLDDRGAGPGAPRRPVPATGGRAWDVALATGWRSGGSPEGGLQVFGRVDHLIGSARRFQISLAVGFTGARDAVPRASAYPGTATVRRAPVELGFWWLQRLPPGELQLGVTAGLELTRLNASSRMLRRTELFPGPTTVAAAGMRFPLGSNAFFRLSAGVGVALVRYDFYFQEGPGAPRMTVFTSPTQRIYGKMAAEVGMALPLTKKSSSGP